MSSPNWWELIKQIFGSSRKNLSGVGSGALQQPPTNPKNACPNSCTDIDK